MVISDKRRAEAFLIELMRLCKRYQITIETSGMSYGLWLIDADTKEEIGKGEILKVSQYGIR